MIRSPIHWLASSNLMRAAYLVTLTTAIGCGGSSSESPGGSGSSGADAVGGSDANMGGEPSGTGGSKSGSGGVAGTETGGTETGGTETGGTETGGTDAGGTDAGGTGGTDAGGTAGTDAGGTDAGGAGAGGTGNPEAGITISEVSGNTTEKGGTATFTVVLDSQPSSTVFVYLKSDDETEGQASPPYTANMQTKLTFTTSDWSSPKTVTMTGQDDDVADGSIEYTVSVQEVSSADPAYDGMTVPKVTLLNVDDETAGITVEQISSTTTETGGTASFKVVLNSKPEADVQVGLASSDTTEGDLLEDVVLFTPTNWDSPVTVTVTGLDDNLADGPIDYDVTFSVASTDNDYNALSVDPLGFVNTDNETAGVTIEQQGTGTTEAGGEATFSIVLNSQPQNNVVFDLASTKASEGSLDKGQLVFTPDNWSAKQTVTVTGADDSIKDGDQPYQVTITRQTSGDAGYDALPAAAPLNFLNADDETSGFVVSEINGPTSEGGQTATFTVALKSQPTADVTISVASSNSAEGSTDVLELVFTPENWNALHPVVVTGQDDASVDGNQPYQVLLGTAVSSDPNYSGIKPPNVDVINVDDESAGFIVSVEDGTTDESGADGGEVTIRLASQPTADVTVDFSVTDATEGSIVGVTSWTFTPANWNSAHSILLNGVDDDVADGPQKYAVQFMPASSADLDYAGKVPPNASLTNTDDETAGFTVSPLTGQTTEQGGTVTVTVKLNTPPLADVTVNFGSSDNSEGRTAIRNLTFTPQDWSSPKSVVVRGIDDLAKDGDQPYELRFTATASTDPAYAAIRPSSVSLVNLDYGDTAGYVLTPGALTTNEAGGTATFTLALTSRPLASVTIGISSLDLTEGAPSPTSVVFNKNNWSTPQTITVKGVDDDLADGDQQLPIFFAPAKSTDVNYTNMKIPNLLLVNEDDDSAGFNVSAVSNDTDETGTTASFTVRLDSQPLSNVTVPVVSSNTSEGTVNKVSLVFTPANWDQDQTVTITGIDDMLVDGDADYSILLGPSASSDNNYKNVAIPPVQLKNLDNDLPQ